MRYLITILLFCSVTIQAQTFEKLYSEFDFQGPCLVVECHDGYFLGLNVGSIYDQKFKLMKIDENGSEVAQIVFPESVGQFQSKILKLTDTTYLVTTFNKNMQGLSYPVFRIFNNELTILKTKVIDTLPPISSSLHIYSEICIINDSTIMNAIGTFSTHDSNHSFIYTIKLNQNLDVEVVNSYKRADLFSLPNSILPYQKSDSSMLFIPSKAFKINNNAEIVDSLPEFFNYFAYLNHNVRSSFTAAFFINDKIFVSGNSYIVAKYNSDFSQDTAIYYEDGEYHRTAYNDPLSAYGEHLYLGGEIGFDPVQYYDPFLGLYSYIRLYRLGHDLSVKWVKSYNQYQGYYYFVFNILATSDGGCLITATRNNYETQGEKVDLYLLKVDSLGNYTPMVDIQEPENQTFTVYPNPGSNYFTIESQDVNSNCELLMYSTTGQIVVRKPLQNSHENIETSTLPTGIYFYEVRSNSGIVGRGKWIKR